MSFPHSRVKVLNMPISDRCGISNVALTHFDGRVFGAAVPEMFDAILLDAPCSGEGVVRKDPDALKNWSPESNQEIAATTQRELIVQRPFTHDNVLVVRSVYSTGTLEPAKKTKPFACG